MASISTVVLLMIITILSTVTVLTTALQCYQCGQFNDGVGSITPCLNYSDSSAHLHLKDCPRKSDKYCVVSDRYQKFKNNPKKSFLNQFVILYNTQIYFIVIVFLFLYRFGWKINENFPRNVFGIKWGKMFREDNGLGMKISLKSDEFLRKCSLNFKSIQNY